MQVEHPQLPPQPRMPERRASPMVRARGLNVSTPERWASALVGGALVTVGLRERSLAGAALAVVGGALAYRGATGHCPAYEAMGVSSAAEGGVAASGIADTLSITINKPIEAVYAFWHNVDNMPKVMPHITEVQVFDDQRSSWVARDPMGRTLSWDAQITEQVRDSHIAWRTLDGSDLEHRGRVEFRPAPGDRGTQVRLHYWYRPPAGALGRGLAKLMRFTKTAPRDYVREGLRRMKQLMETGEFATGESYRTAAPSESVRRSRRKPDRVAQASEESFPASDSPGYYSSRA